MTEFKPPNLLAIKNNKPCLGLFGSIEQGKATNWQKKVTEYLDCYDLNICNSRREYWDDKWELEANNKAYNEQIVWELQALDVSNVQLFYFEPNTKSPITLTLFGMSAAQYRPDILVCCPNGYWRKGLIDILCKKYGIHQEDTLENLTSAAASRLREYYSMSLLPNRRRTTIPPKVTAVSLHEL